MSRTSTTLWVFFCACWKFDETSCHHTRVDVDSGVLLVVQKDNRIDETPNSEPQAVADALAVFYVNNIRRRRVEKGSPTREDVLAIIMISTNPILLSHPNDDEAEA
ncbi:hypothetical protein BXZ70DRAFT_1079305, partial [Cristinia sonorae]